MNEKTATILSIGMIRLACPNGPSPLRPESMKLVQTAAGQLGAAVGRVKAQIELQRAHDDLEIRVRKRSVRAGCPERGTQRGTRQAV